MKTHAAKSFGISFAVHTTALTGLFLYQAYLLNNMELAEPPQKISLIATITEANDEPPPIEVEIVDEPEDQPEPEEPQPEPVAEEPAAPDFAISPFLQDALEKMDVPIEKYQSLGSVIDGFDEMSDEQKIKTLEQAIAQANQFSPESLLGATGFVKNRLGVQQREFQPINEVEFFESTENLLPFYRFIEIDGQEYFQALAVDEKGNYAVVKTVPKDEMSAEDEKNMRIFTLTNSSPALREMRNVSLELIGQMLNAEEAARYQREKEKAAAALSPVPSPLNSLKPTPE